MGIEPHDVVTAAGLDPQAHADDHLAVRHDRTARDMKVGAVDNARLHALFRRDDCPVPAQLAGLHIQGDDMTVGGGGIEFVRVERHALHPRLAAAMQGFGQHAPVLPQDGAVGGIDRFDGIRAFDEQHAVVDQRRRLVGAERQRQRPGNAQVAHGALVDLIERAVGEGSVGAAPHQPVGGRRGAQHGVRHRRELLEQRLAGSDGGMKGGVLVVEAREGRIPCGAIVLRRIGGARRCQH